MPTRAGARRFEPPEEVGGVPVREIELDEVKDAYQDQQLQALIAHVVRSGHSFEVPLTKIRLELIPFRSRIYRRARSAGLRAHVFRVPGDRGLVRIYSHPEGEGCELCELTSQ